MPEPEPMQAELALIRAQGPLDAKRLAASDRVSVLNLMVPDEVLLERMFGELNEKQDDYLKDIKSSEQLSFELAAKDRLIAGSPAQCLEQLQMWKEEIQPDYVMLRMRQPGGPPQAEALADIRLFGEKVIPNL